MTSSAPEVKDWFDLYRPRASVTYTKSRSVYALVEPITFEARYVGISGGLRGRWGDHIRTGMAYGASERHPKDQWLFGVVRAHREPPPMVILQSGADEEDELRWIFNLIERRHRLFNKALGVPLYVLAERLGVMFPSPDGELSKLPRVDGFDPSWLR